MTRSANAAPGFEVFATPSDSPRVRRHTDLVSAAALAALLTFLALVAGEQASLDTTTLEFVGELPDWFVWIGQALYVIGVLYALALLFGVAVLARSRLDLLANMLLAAVLAVVIAVLLTRLIDARWPELAFLDLDETRSTFPTFFVTTAAAIQASASPFLSAPMRRVGWITISVSTVATALSAVGEVSDTVGAVLVGLLSASVVRYALGTTAGLPSTDRVEMGLADLGVDVPDLRLGDVMLTSSVVFVGTTTEGTPIHVNVLGRDSWHSRRWSRVWSQAWYHDQGAQYGSNRRQQVEHSALAFLLAERAGVAVPRLVASGMSDVDDGMLVTERYDRTLRDLPIDEIDDDLLDEIWRELTNLREAGISNGRLDHTDIWIDASGRPAIAGFSDSAIHANDTQLNEDIASLLVGLSLLVGVDRTVGSARRVAGDDIVISSLPVLQTAVLSPTLRRQARQHKLKIADLRKQVAETLDVDEPEIEQLHRVSITSVVTTVLAGVAFYSIISGLADVGLDTIADSLSDARWGLVLIALVMTQATNLTDALSASAVSPKRIPIGVTTVEQISISFIKLATPGNTGQIATNARFFGKFGMGAVTAMTVGVITGIVSMLSQVILIVLTIVVGKGSIDLSSLESSGGVLRILVFVIGLLVVSLVVVVLVPRLRRWLWSMLEKPLAQAGEGFAQLRQPRKAALTFGGAFGTELLYGGGLAVCVLAVGGSVSLGEAIFVNLVVSLFASLMPVPGGVGVYEGGAIAGLVAVGVDNEIAVSAVLLYRMCSFYLPPIWGYISLRWLRNHDYL